MIAHVAVILGEGYTGVYGRFTRGDGHIRGVRYEHRSVRQGLARARVGYLAELFKSLGHLVAALAAADIYDDIRVAPLCKLMLRHGFARSEAAGYCRRAALCYREERIYDTLTGYQRTLRGQSAADGARDSDRPALAERQLMSVAFFVL